MQMIVAAKENSVDEMEANETEEENSAHPFF